MRRSTNGSHVTRISAQELTLMNAVETHAVWASIARPVNTTNVNHSTSRGGSISATRKYRTAAIHASTTGRRMEMPSAAATRWSRTQQRNKPPTHRAVTTGGIGTARLRVLAATGAVEATAFI